MNSCILMAKIIRTPELRYTQDNQTPFAQILLEFEGLRPEEPPATLRAIGWGSLGTDIAEKYTEGDQVILEGRLSMRDVERPEGFKEKRAELVISHIYRLEGYLTSTTAVNSTLSTSRADKVLEMSNFKSKAAPSPSATAKVVEDLSPHEPPAPVAPAKPPLDSSAEENLDDIPF